ncbi:lysozyme inhibitor LprI family protein [Mucilaginibacter sp.]
MKIQLGLRAAWLVLGLTILTSFAKAQSQTAMNMEAGDGYAKADRELNVVYQKILKSYAAQPIFIKKFKTAQRLWVQLRDAELEARYPDTGDGRGSAEPMCKSIYLEKLTKERTSFLNIWLTGIPEGDVCTGSVKMSR